MPVRQQLSPFLTKLSPLLVGMEVVLERILGTRDRQWLSYGRTASTDRLGIIGVIHVALNIGLDEVWAWRPPSMPFVPKKSTSQQDVQVPHRIRAQFIKWRTALANEIDSARRGRIVVPGGVVGFAPDAAAHTRRARERTERIVSPDAGQMARRPFDARIR